MKNAMVVFTRDLRLHDNPALHLACSRAERVLPVFIEDPVLTAAPNRMRFLAESLAAVREGLRRRGADLVIRRGDPAAELMRLAAESDADAVFIADDVSGYAARRRRRLERECSRHRLDLVCTPGVTVVPPGELRPSGGGHYRVFTPYWRAWRGTAWRPAVLAPERIRTPPLPRSDQIPRVRGRCSPGLLPGGEHAGRARVRDWLDGGLAAYPAGRDDLAVYHNSRLSPYLRFGCVSPLELARSVIQDTAVQEPGGEEFCRQLAWRDFFYQVTAAFPGIGRADYRPRGEPWHHDQDALRAWQAGQTGVPIVDAGMRQLAEEGFMHNRARMITASYLTRNLGIHWRYGYLHFASLLADGDLACNAGNWQWVAGTGNNTRPGQVMNPLRQARRFDPAGDYVRRYVN